MNLYKIVHQIKQPTVTMIHISSSDTSDSQSVTIWASKLLEPVNPPTVDVGSSSFVKLVPEDMSMTEQPDQYSQKVHPEQLPILVPQKIVSSRVVSSGRFVDPNRPEANPIKFAHSTGE